MRLIGKELIVDNSLPQRWCKKAGLHATRYNCSDREPHKKNPA